MDIRLVHGDCLEGMRKLADGSVVTIADPPYGIGRDWAKRSGTLRMRYRDCRYMNVRPPPEYFAEMLRVSSDWLVWGWNYFTDILPPTNYLLVWDKMSNNNPVFKYSKCEIAGTSWKVPCNIVAIGWDGYRMGEETGTTKIHPHQKPVALYRWVLETYLPDRANVTVLDPFMGSASLAIACLDKGVGTYIGCEVEDMFFDAAEARVRTACGPNDTITVERQGGQDAEGKDGEAEGGEPLQG